MSYLSLYYTCRQTKLQPVAMTIAVSAESGKTFSAGSVEVSRHVNDRLWIQKGFRLSIPVVGMRGAPLTLGQTNSHRLTKLRVCAVRAQEDTPHMRKTMHVLHDWGWPLWSSQLGAGSTKSRGVAGWPPAESPEQEPDLYHSRQKKKRLQSYISAQRRPKEKWQQGATVARSTTCSAVLIDSPNQKCPAG